MALRKERVAERLLQLREVHSLTQEQAAAHVGVTMRQWQRWEAGDSMPYARNLEQIAERFEVPVADFYDGQSAMSPVADARDVAQVLELLTQLVERQTALTDSVTAVAEETASLRGEIAELRRDAPKRRRGA